MKKTIALVLVSVFLVFALSACSVSSSSTTTSSFSTSVTDADGNTTTNTTSSEVGVSAGTDGVSTTVSTTTNSTTTPADDGEAENAPLSREALSANWHEKFSGGANGTSVNGDEIYIAFDDADIMMYGLIMYVTNGGDSLVSREGRVEEVDDHLVLFSDSMNDETPFTITDNDGETFTMTFVQDGDEATMTIVDADTIIDEMINVLSEFTDVQ